MEKCRRCKRYSKKYDCAECKPDYKITNADRIRSMSDKELAKFLVTFRNTFGDEYEGEMSCLDWLQSEV